MADVADSLKDWSATAHSNNPQNADSIGVGLAPNLREIQKVVRQDLANAAIDASSSTTTDLGSVASNYVRVTGTTTIDALGTVSAGIWKFVRFADALTLTHNATSLILPGGSDITTAEGDVAWFISEGSGNWRCIHFQRKATGPGSGFPSGTKMLFQQTSAPTGWTKDTSSHNNKALRVVTGDASYGGATGFTSVFGSGKTTGAKTLSTSEIPAHAHGINVATDDGGGNPIQARASGGNNAIGAGTNNAGSGGSHDHTLSLDIQYVDVIIATKD